MAAKQGELFVDLPPPEGKPLRFKPQTRPVWTENKAKFIERYLFYFVLVTKHGAYIDGFAGPQDPKNPESWSCKLVLESKPQLLREFWFCELSDSGFAALESMVASTTKPKNRTVECLKGDFNQKVEEVLRRCNITATTAAFCLLDQRTFECEWQTVQKLSAFKDEGAKIEIFYFLATGWLDRSIAGTTKNKDQLNRWWGNEGWQQLRGMKGQPRAELVSRRFRDELGYKHSYAWPIYDRGNEGRVMYHMIHATDHPEAPKLMNRAYFNATKARESLDKLQLELEALWAPPASKQ